MTGLADKSTQLHTKRQSHRINVSAQECFNYLCETNNSN